MNYYIIIRGPLGVGKSTISKLLARKIKAEVIHFDEIMDDLGLNYIPGEKWIPLHKFLKANKIMIPKFRKKLGNKKRIILDGNFYHKKQIEDLINNLSFSHFVFTLKADLKECIKRDKRRTGMLGEQATKDVFKLVSSFDYGIVINTNGKIPEDIVEEIVSYLRSEAEGRAL